MQKKKPDTIIQHLFDWADYAERIVKYIIFIGFLILGVFIFKSAVGFLNSYINIQKENIILKQKELEFMVLPSGASSSGYDVVTKKDIEKILRARNAELLKAIKDMKETISEMGTVEVVDTSTGANSAIETENGWVNYADRYDEEQVKSHELWVQFSPLYGFVYDIHHNISITSIRTEREDDQTLRSYIQAVNNYTGEIMDVESFETQVEEHGFIRNLNLPEWGFYSGMEVSSRSNVSAILGVRYDHWSGYFRKEMLSLDGDQVSGDTAVGVMYHFELSRWFRRSKAFH